MTPTEWVFFGVVQGSCTPSLLPTDYHGGGHLDSAMKAVISFVFLVGKIVASSNILTLN